MYNDRTIAEACEIILPKPARLASLSIKLEFEDPEGLECDAGDLHAIAVHTINTAVDLAHRKKLRALKATIRAGRHRQRRKTTP
jgi:hypothetical protein